MFDGSPVSDYEAGSLRKRIDYVPQQPRLLTDTIFENLRYGNPEAIVAKVHHSAKIAGIHKCIHCYNNLAAAMPMPQTVNLACPSTIGS